MAERRMFAKSVIGSARFLRMPPTSRLLYYDLGMQADDDGVVEAFSVMRTTGATEDDLRVLASKGFVSVLNDDLVTYITDWSRNNYIQKDRYHPSVYQEILVKLNDGSGMDSGCIQGVSGMDTQVRLGKDSIGDSRADKPPRRFVPPTVEEVRDYCQKRGNGIDPEAFVDFYTAKGWAIGHGKMKDWRAAVRTWEKRRAADPGVPSPQPRRTGRLTVDENGEEVVRFD